MTSHTKIDLTIMSPEELHIRLTSIQRELNTLDIDRDVLVDEINETIGELSRRICDDPKQEA